LGEKLKQKGGFSMIRLQKDAEVFSSAGEKVGHLVRVVLDPESKKTTHIIVTKGFLFSSSKVIPISYVDRNGERLTLTKNAMELDDLPDYVESSFISPDRAEPTEDEAETVYFYPPRNVSWWTLGSPIWYSKPEYVMKSEKVLPEGLVALDEGAKVLSKDGKELGEVERVIIESYEKRATHIVVSRGFLMKEYKLVPTMWITDVTDEKVYLSIDANLFERLPERELVS